MRLLQALSYGTERYPEKVARRLRAFNFGCWGVAFAWLAVAAFYLADIKLRTVVIIQIMGAIIFVALPLLHRIGPRAAPIAFLIVCYPATFAVCAILGTDIGLQLNYMGFAAAAVLVLGTNPIAPALAFAILALVFSIALEIFAPHDGGLLSEAAILGSFIASVTGTGAIMFALVFYAVREVTRAEASAEFEHERSESLLANILPAAVANRLKSRADRVIADKHEEASILFADMAGFTAWASATAPVDLVGFLNEVFTAFDRLVERHGLEKIKTTGDNYMVVSGVPVSRSDHAAALVQLALEMLDAARHIHDPHGREVSIRIGIASGPVVAGVVGMKKFFYDVWGDAVNVASRMESTGVPGRIQISPETFERVKDQFEFESRGPIEVRGKGKMTTWLLTGPRTMIANSPDSSLRSKKFPAA
jgi:adenylate cyclase